MRCADLILPLIISLLQLHHETSIYGFIFTSVSPITAKLSRMIDLHTLTMPYIIALRLWLYLHFLKVL